MKDIVKKEKERTPRRYVIPWEKEDFLALKFYLFSDSHFYFLQSASFWKIYTQDVSLCVYVP